MTLLRLLLGAICGICATGPMSAVMVWLHRRLPSSERYPLPPREITGQAVEQVTDPRNVAPEVRSALTWLAHFGYGGATGIIYSTLDRKLPGTSIVRGPIYGLIVWTISYLGLLPGLHVLKPATEHPARRNALMIGAHLVWGLFLAVIFRAIFEDRGRTSAAFHTSPRVHQDVERDDEPAAALRQG
jgi:uncharacterized membrane protein YagU involved in acid resistance